MAKEEEEAVYSEIDEPVDNSQPIAIQPFQLDQTEKEEEAPLQKVFLDQLKIQVEDIFMPLATAMKHRRQAPDQVFKKYDADRSSQMSVKEMTPIVQEFLAFELTEYEKNMILSTIKKDYRASEIKKQAFLKLLERKAKRSYNTEKAHSSFAKIVQGLSDVQGAFDNIFNRRPELLYRQNHVCLRNFKLIV